MPDPDAYIQKLLETNPLREPALRSVIQALQLPAGSQGLDAGCGVGFQSVLLAEALGSHGRVTGLDLSPEMLGCADEVAKKSGLSERISFRQGDVSQLPFDDRSFDWVWSADCVGYPVSNLLPLLQELKRVTKVGGSIIILAWSSQQLLPGHPLLEAHLNANCAGYAPFFKGVKPEAHFARAMGWFRHADLENVSAQTFVGTIQAPLDRRMQGALVSLFQMLWGESQSDVSQNDWAEYQRLCRPESPDFIGGLPDYYSFFTYSMFQGTVPGTREEGG